MNLPKYELTVHPGESVTSIVRSIPDDGEEAVVHLCAGTYHEKVEIFRSHTLLEGCGREHTIIAWNDRASDILEDGTRRGTFRTATFRTDAD